MRGLLYSGYAASDLSGAPGVIRNAGKTGGRLLIQNGKNTVSRNVTGKAAKGSKAVRPSTGPLKNASGNLDDAAASARNQGYGPVNNSFRRLPKSAQDLEALQGAQAGKGRLIIKSLSDPRYRGW